MSISLNKRQSGAGQDAEPLVSIIMPCYKMGKYVSDALESVGGQTYQNWEILVVDDCGPDDGTRECVESFAQQHPEHRVEYIRHEKNRGVSAARNTAIAQSKGKYLAFLDPDDFWGEIFLSEHLRALESNHEVSLTYSTATFVDRDGQIAGGNWGPTEQEVQGLPESIYLRNFIAPCAAVARTDAVTQCGGFDEADDLQHVEDWDLWLEMLHNGARFVHTPSAEAFYRKHDAAATADPAAMRRRRAALGRKHADLPAPRTLELIANLEERVRRLERKQMKYDNSLFARINRLFSRSMK